uniref:Venom protein family 1 protein 1 n=1 Tax=Pristhesancus plagipennis TaxID=1955184 RepID=A0A1Q1NPC4_PRIPG|nr:venom protein family 1 protein 1 [Pristhesancus plagipennis]
MANTVFITCLIAAFCFIGCFGDEAEVQAFWKTRENAVFQFRLAKVEIESSLYQKTKVAMDKAKTEEQRDCMDDAKSKGIAESTTILDETVGKILPEIKEVSESLKLGDETKLKEFNKKWNYTDFKAKAMESFKAKANKLNEQVQAGLNKCMA